MSAALLVYDPDVPSETRAYEQRISRELPSLKVAAASTFADAVASANEASILVAKAQDITAALVAALPKLRWIQVLTTGVDPLRALDIPATVTITSARGIHGPQMVELALLYMLSLYRD